MRNPEHVEIVTRVFARFERAMMAEGRPIRPAEDRVPYSLIASMHGYCRRRPPAGFEARNVFEAVACGLAFEPTRRPQPTGTLPATAERIEVYRRRLHLGEVIFDADDRRLGET